MKYYSIHEKVETFALTTQNGTFIKQKLVSHFFCLPIYILVLSREGGVSTHQYN